MPLLFDNKVKRIISSISYNLYIFKNSNHFPSINLATGQFIIN